MEVRSYYASTVEAAMQLALKELGPEAMLIQSSRTEPELAHLGRYEVVFAGETQTAAPKIPLRGLQKQRLSPDEAAVLGPVDLLASQPPPAPSQPSFSALFAAAGLKLEDDAGVSKQPAPQASKSRAFACSPGLGHTGSPQSAVALVGPPGSGKTTAIMKLAIAHGVVLSRPVKIFAYDPQRIGATRQLNRFADLLAIEFREFEKLPELSRALSMPFPGLLFVDTPSFGRADASVLAALADCLRAQTHVETQLVLRADRKAAANLSSLERFSAFGSSRLILTALDETDDHSDLADLIDRAELPVSFLGTGQRIPEDMEPARSSRLSNVIDHGWRESSQAAAA